MTKLAFRSENSFWLACAAIVVFVYFFGLNIPLLGPDEPRYAQVAREMFERNDWVTPTLGGYHWFEKPSLLYWLQIASYTLFGVSEFAARFGSAWFGLGTAAAMWILGRTYADELNAAAGEGSGPRPVPQSDVANWFGLLMASSLGLIVFARGASFDIILTFPIAAALVSYYVFDSRSRKRVTASGGVWLPLFLFYFFTGVALLAKGLVGAVFPFTIVFVYHLISRRLPSRIVFLSVVWGGILAMLIASTWYLPMWLRHGWEFIDNFIVQHHFQRYTSNKYLHPQPFYFFFWVLPLMTIPWLPFFFGAVWRFARRAFNGIKRNQENSLIAENNVSRSDAERDANGSSALLKFAASWVLVPSIFFSFSGSKLPGYILPVLPAAVALTAVYLLELIRRNSGLERWLRGLAVATFAVVTVLLIFVLPRFADTDSVKGLLADAAQLGHRNEKVLTFFTLSHNAEFYAPGRLVRDESGRQKRLDTPAEVKDEILKIGAPGALVLVPIEHEARLSSGDHLLIERIRDNGDLALAYVRPKD